MPSSGSQEGATHAMTEDGRIYELQPSRKGATLMPTTREKKERLRFLVETPPGSQGVTAFGLAETLDDELGFSRGTVRVVVVTEPKQQERCPTCGSIGYVLDYKIGDPMSGGDTKPCPDCTPAEPVEQGKPVERFRVRNVREGQPEYVPDGDPPVYYPTELEIDGYSSLLEPGSYIVPEASLTTANQQIKLLTRQRDERKEEADRYLSALRHYADEGSWINRSEFKAFPDFHGREVAERAISEDNFG